MGRVIKERLKTICIFILVMTGISQVGILWSYQSQGTPTSFLSGLFSQPPQISDEIVREKLFIPDKLILSDGGKSHWIIKKDSDVYNTLWDEAFKGLYQIMSGKVSLTKVNEEWGTVAEKRGYMVDFGYAVKSDLLAWFLGTADLSQEISDVIKVMIKSDLVDENTGNFYIYGSDGSVYISNPIRYEKASSTEKFIKTASENKNREYREYTTLRGSNIGKANDQPDVYYVMKAPKYWPYYKYTAKPPVRAMKEDDLDEILLGSEKDRYNKSTDNANTIQFNYGNSIYRYYSDGYLTYQYLGNTDASSKDEVNKSLVNAYKFIARIYMIYETKPDIILTSVKIQSDGSYLFGFDYKIQDIPVETAVNRKDGSGEALKNAISIQADSKRVIKCDWLLKEFIQGEKDNYNDRFEDLLAMTGLKFMDISIQDIYAGYYIHSTVDEMLNPMLLIELKNQPNIRIEMLAEKGD